jgi:hypothetical protein
VGATGREFHFTSSKHEYLARNPPLLFKIDQIKDAAKNTNSPKLISESEITTLGRMNSGQKIILKKIVHVKEFFFLYTRATLV